RKSPSARRFEEVDQLGRRQSEILELGLAALYARDAVRALEVEAELADRRPHEVHCIAAAQIFPVRAEQRRALRKDVGLLVALGRLQRLDEAPDIVLAVLL